MILPLFPSTCLLPNMHSNTAMLRTNCLHSMHGNTAIMLRTNCFQSMPLRPYLSRSSFRFGPKLPFAPTLGFGNASEVSTKKWKISCVRDDEFSSGTPNQESAGEILHEPEKAEIDKPSVERKNRPTGLLGLIDAVSREIGKPWTVPWKAETILKVSLLWFISFWIIKFWLIPSGARVLGMNKNLQVIRGKAIFSLLTNVTLDLVGVYILHLCLSKFRPLPSDWFEFRLLGTWPIDVLLGCFLFPYGEQLLRFTRWVPFMRFAPIACSSVVLSIVTGDKIAFILFTVVLVVYAPLWEEMYFRGFLLPSLTRYMPVWCSILVTSVVYALAQFDLRRVIPYTFLGVMLGATYVRTRNLLPAVILHGLWNGLVLLGLLSMN